MDEQLLKKIALGYFSLKTMLLTIGLVLYITDSLYVLNSLQYVSFLFGDVRLLQISLLIPVLLILMSFLVSYFIYKETGIGRVLAIVVLIFDLFSFPVGTILSLAFIVYFLSEYHTMGSISEKHSTYRAIGVFLIAFSFTSTAMVMGVFDEYFAPQAISPQAKIQTFEPSTGEVEVIIELRPATGTAAVQMQSVTIQSIQALGGEITDSMITVSNSLLTTIDAENLLTLAADPNILSITENKQVWFAPQSTQKGYTRLLDDSYQYIDIQALWDAGLTGENVVVAIVDTGINSNLPIFKRNGENIVIDEFSITGNEYVLWHGTAVASCIASQDQSRKGIAPGVDLLNVNVFQTNGGAYTWDIAKGWDWVAKWQLSHQDTFVICCNSLGAHPLAVGCGGWISPSILDRNANNMVIRNNIPMVVAAGNYNSFYPQSPLKVNSPGQARYVLTVGAINDKLNIADFSCRGGTEDNQPKPDVVAPGVNIRMFNSDGLPISASGTSFATPLVAGVVALLAQDHGDYSSLQVQDAIKDGADDLGSLGYDTTYGYGIVNAEDALAIINGQKPEKIYTNVDVGDISIPLGILPILGIIGLIVVFSPEIKKRK